MRSSSLISLEDFLSCQGLVHFITSTRFVDVFDLKTGNGSGEYGSDTTAGSNATVLAALGTSIDYLGTEISVNDLFERLLWPQRYYNNPPAHSIWRIAFLIPMGGPLHKAALRTLDTFDENGMFKGSRRGHMLGTAFFGNTARSYNVHAGRNTPTAEHVRNGL